MKIGESEFKVICKDGKFFVKHSYNGSHFQNEYSMMIYNVKSKPYVKKFGERFYLTEELLQELKEAM